MAGNVKVTGLPELIQKLNSLGEPQTLASISHRATFGASKDLSEAARNFAPRGETGALKRAFAIKRIVYGTRRGYTVGLRAGRSRNKRSADDPYYWWWVEFGTRFIAPQGFFRQAIAMQRDRAPRQIIEAGLKAVLDSGNRALKRFGSGKK